MHKVEPDVYIVAESVVSKSSLLDYLTEIGAESWTTNAESGIEELVEVMGRGCYKSFGTDLNPNITKVREGNREYIENIIKVGHGSVLEHSWVSFLFTNVSRVFTHELVRHRVGTAISQESLRYVRLTDLGMWIPECFRGNKKAEEIFKRAFSQAEENYRELLSEEVLGVNIDKEDFYEKKQLTSGARRIAPIGLATNIGWSCNIRTLRHLIELRTSNDAEEEMRLVFNKVARLSLSKWPSLFSDFKSKGDGEYLEYIPENSKI